MSHPVRSAEVEGDASIPFLRTFQSQRFRLLVATILAALGIVLSVLRLITFDTTDPSVALDFAAYYRASERMLAGQSPYTVAQLDGSGSALCLDCYLYPPFLALLISPITLVPLATAKVIWFVISYAAAFVSAWLATGIGGARRSLERALWCFVAVLLFDPVASAVWVGNVGALMALSVTLVAMGGVAAGIGAGLGTLIKVVPGTLIPAVLVGGRRSRNALLLTLGVVTGALFLLAPEAWLQYPAVLTGVFTDPSQSHLNLAPSQVMSDWGPGVVGLVRAAVLFAGVLCIVASTLVAWRRGAMPAAALLGTVAMLVIPGTLWFHYLAVLLPFAAMAWPRAGVVARAFLLIGATLVALYEYVDLLAMVYLGSASVLVAAGWVLWPRSADGSLTDPYASLGT